MQRDAVPQHGARPPIWRPCLDRANRPAAIAAIDDKSARPAEESYENMNVPFKIFELLAEAIVTAWQAMNNP